MENKEVIKIDIEVLNKVMQYLAEQKYNEVAKLINDVHISIQNNNKEEQEKTE
ncbi:MAG: hypothetical protein ACOCVF_03055 [bacterium]